MILWKITPPSPASSQYRTSSPAQPTGIFAPRPGHGWLPAAIRPESTWSIWPSWQKKIGKGATIVVHNLKESKEICRKAIDKYGETAQIYLAMVEARYLAPGTSTISRLPEGGGARRTSWKSRLFSCRSKRAKVKLMLTQLDFIFGAKPGSGTGGAVQDGGEYRRTKEK